MNIEAVTVCVNYGDFIREIAPLNAPLFNRWIIVTEAADEETRMVCSHYGLTCVVSEDHRQDGGSAGKNFNKGALIDRGLQLCSRNSWRLHLDADIALPTQFRHLLNIANPQQDCIHGVDRVNVQGWEQWQALLRSGWLHHASNVNHLNIVHLPQGVPVGARWCSWRTGYAPLGYFQLWHSSQDEHGWAMTKQYPKNSGDACHSDTQHAMQWDRHKRVFIPEIVAVHIDSEPAHTGANWAGRKTKRFGPPAPKLATVGYPPPPKTYEGEIIWLEKNLRELFLLSWRDSSWVKASPTCQITIHGKVKPFADLRLGEKITITGTGNHPIIATSIVVK